MEFDVVTLPDTDHPTSGDVAPSFTRPLVAADDWADHSLATLLDSGPVTLVCHPMAGAFPSLYIWEEITDRDWGSATQLVGLSISSPYELKQFIRDRGIDDHALFSDPAATVAEAYGVTHDLDGMAGIVGYRPAVFVIDTDRRVEAAWVAEEWPAFPPYDDLEPVLRDL